MRRLYLIAGLAVAVKGASIPVTEDPSVQIPVGITHNWRYDTQTEPNYLEPSMWDGTCNTGNRQSPIDIVAADLTQAKHDVPKVVNHLYELPITGSLYNSNRHITYAIAQNLRPYISGGPLDSKYVFDHMDFHFGATSSEGSEHTIGGKKYPMEISLTFYDGEQYTDIKQAAAAGTMGAMASVSYMVEVSSADNEALKEIVDNLQNVANPTTPSPIMAMATTPFPLDTQNMNIHDNVVIDLEKIFGLDITDFYYYDGSLTSPSCSENVKWILSTKKLKISETQLDAFRQLQSYDSDYLRNNFRPVQTGDRITDIKTDGVFWRRSKFEIDANAAQIFGASLVGAGVFHNMYTLLKQPETAKTLRENPLVELVSNLPFFSDQEQPVQRSSEEVVQEFQQQQPVYQPQQYQQYVPQPVQTA